MALVSRRRSSASTTATDSATGTATVTGKTIDEWPYLDEEVLLTSRCQGWTDDMTSQRGWAAAGA